MGILTNDNFDVNAPKNIDSRYSVSGVTPYASVAAANAAISLTRRAIGLTVNVNGDEYWYKNGTTDPDLILKSSGSGSVVVPITKAALLALIAASTVVIGTTYSVTDAQDALDGTITVLGIATNAVDGNGIWTFTGNLPAQGRIKFMTGNAGSVTQIVVTTPGGPVNAMTASVPYTTSRNNTATLVAANINANTTISGIRAHVITSTTLAGNFDTPTLVIEIISAQTGFSYTITPTLVTLTTTNTAGTLGFNSNALKLNSFYDITNDRILYASDPVMWCTVDNTLARITALGYNPVTTFRWRDPRFIGMRLIDSGIRNTTFRNLATAFWRNITITGSNIQGCIFTNVAQTNVDIFSGSTVNNVNSTSLNISNVSGTINIQNVDAAAVNVTNNFRAAFTLLTSTFGNATTNGIISYSNNLGGCNIQTVNCTNTGTNGISANTMQGSSIISISGCTFSGIFTISNNYFNSGATISSTSTFVNLTINRNRFKGALNLNALITTGDFNILRNDINDDGTGAGLTLTSSTVPILNITDSTFVLVFIAASVFTGTLNVVDSTIHKTSSVGKMNGVFNIVNSEIGPNTQIGTATIGVSPSIISISNSIIQNTDYSRVHKTTLSNSIVKACALIFDPSLTDIIINFTKCNFFDSTLETDPILLTAITSSDLICNNVVANNVTFYAGEPGFTTYSNSFFENSIVGLTTSTGGGATTLVVNNSTINDSTLFVRDFFGATNIDGVYIEKSFLQDDGINLGIGNLTVTNSKFFNSTIFVNTDPGTYNTTISNCQVTNQILNFNQAYDTIFVNTVISNGVYTITHSHDFSTNNLIVGVPFTLNYLPIFFVFDKITYTSNGTLVGGGGATLGLGYAGTYDQYINNVTIAAINAGGTIRTYSAVSPDTTTGVQDLSLNATVANITAGTLKLVLEGEIFN